MQLVFAGEALRLCSIRFLEMGSDCLALFGEPCVLLDGNLTVRVTEKGKSWFVWKKLRMEATPERVRELTEFVSELKLLLEPRA